MLSNKVKLPVFALGWMLCALVAANAQEAINPEKRALVKELYTLLHMDKQMEQILEQMQSVLPNMIDQTSSDLSDLKPEDQAEMKKLLAGSSARLYSRMREEISKRLDLAAITEQMFVPVYAKYFSEDDLRALITFYKSPTGQKMVALTPTLFRESMQQVAELLMPKLMPLTREIFEEEKQRVLKELKQRRN